MKNIARFDEECDNARVEIALRTRDLFIRAFPADSLGELTLEKYAFGKGDQTFCYFVQTVTRAWAHIDSSPLFKFGIYFGKTKTDSARKYRSTKKFGTEQSVAFAAVKNALIDLVELGRSASNFIAIDANPLSPMFKAKILSLYYPDSFLAVCSPEDIRLLAKEMEFPAGLPCSNYQNLLLELKRSDATTAQWSHPKFMLYLYSVYVRPSREIAGTTTSTNPVPTS